MKENSMAKEAKAWITIRGGKIGKNNQKEGKHKKLGGGFLHIVDSYLELTTAPMTIRKFNEVKKEENDTRRSLDAASLYIVAKREVPQISLLKQLPEWVENKDYILPMQITLQEAGVVMHAYYALPDNIEKTDLTELK